MNFNEIIRQKLTSNMQIRLNKYFQLITGTATGIVTRSNPGNGGQTNMEHQSGTLTLTATSVRTNNKRRYADAPLTTMLKVRVFDLT